MTNRVLIVLMMLMVAYVSGCAAVAPPAAAAPGAAAPAAAAAPGTPGAPGSPATTTTANGTTVVAVSPPAASCCPPPTLWQFLGVANLFKHLGADLTQLRNCLGSIFPGLEATPPLTAITDPSNLNSSNPAESAAASAKADEDAAPQKIKAIRYLATLGCAGCYAGVEEALLAALDDCTESVRYEAVKALRDLSGKPCSSCKTKSCCSPKVHKRLDEVANKMEHGCYKESSARVRRLARLALAGCGGSTPKTPEPKEGPSEGPTRAAPKPATARSSGKRAEPTLADANSEDSSDDASNGAGTTAATKAAAAEPVPEAVTQARVAEAVAQVQAFMRPKTNPDCGCVESAPVIIPITVPNSPVQRASNTSNGSGAASGSSASATGTPGGAASADAAAPGLAQSLAATFLRAAGLTAGSQTEAGMAAATSSPATERNQSTAQTKAPAKEIVIQTVGTELAEVNGQPVFEGDVLPAVDRQLAALGPNVPLDEKLSQRPAVIRRELARVIDRKLLCQESQRTAAGVVTASHTAGDAEEVAQADAWLKRVVRVDENVDSAEISAFYQANGSHFMRPGEVRYEEVAAPIAKFPSRDHAYAAIRYVRDRVQGIAVQPPAVNLAAIEVHSFNWTRRDEITSPGLAAALFQSPIGAPSQPFDTGDALRVIRVLERHTAGPAPLLVVAETIRQQIIADRREYLAAAYVAQLRGRAEIWTVFDPVAANPAQFARPASADERP